MAMRTASARTRRSMSKVRLVRGIVLSELEVLGSFTSKPPSPFPRAWLTVMVPSSERSDYLSAHTSPRLMPVVSASSMAMPIGAGCARLASSSMRVRSVVPQFLS